MQKRSRKMPGDPSKLAKKISDLATSDEPEKEAHKGGFKGGEARAAKITAKEWSEAAGKAARARWKREN